jgi:FkbM family methyltransferase
MNPFECIDLYELPKIKSILQVGASGGQEISLFLKNNIIECLLIEPLDYPFAVLCDNVKGIDNYIPVKTAVGARDNEVIQMYVASNDGQSSSILKPAKHTSIFPGVNFNSKVNIKSFTLDGIVSYINQTNKKSAEAYDLIYVDVQGAELEVFKGASKSIINAKYIFTEVGYGGGYENDSSYVEIIQYLNAFSYKLVDIRIDPRTGYGDAFFINMQSE